MNEKGVNEVLQFFLFHVSLYFETLMNLHALQKQLGSLGFPLFNSQELRRATGMTRNAIRLWLIRQIKIGIVVPLKKRRGIYCFADHPPHVWVIANILYRPSYISLETALSYYGILPESIYTITSVSTKTSRSFKAMGKEFLFQKIKKEAFCGYQTLSIDNNTVLIADKEKALADYLYFVHLGKKSLNDRLRWEKVNIRKVLGYLKKFQRPGQLL